MQVTNQTLCGVVDLRKKNLCLSEQFYYTKLTRVQRVTVCRLSGVASLHAVVAVAVVMSSLHYQPKKVTLGSVGPTKVLCMCNAHCASTAAME